MLTKLVLWTAHIMYILGGIQASQRAMVMTQWASVFIIPSDTSNSMEIEVMHDDRFSEILIIFINCTD